MIYVLSDQAGNILAQCEQEAAPQLFSFDYIPARTDADGELGPYQVWKLKIVDGALQWVAVNRALTAAEKTAQEMQEIKAEAEQTQSAAKLYVQAIDTTIDDVTALDVPDFFKTWQEVLNEGKELAANRIINKDGKLYRVVQAVTPVASQPPDAEGMLAIYRPIQYEHTGTADDPIPYMDGMDTEQGKYYSYNDKIYLCNLTMAPCVWPPDTAGLWQWTEVTAQ